MLIWWFGSFSLWTVFPLSPDLGWVFQLWVILSVFTHGFADSWFFSCGSFDPQLLSIRGRNHLNIKLWCLFFPPPLECLIHGMKCLGIADWLKISFCRTYMHEILWNAAFQPYSLNASRSFFFYASISDHYFCCLWEEYIFRNSGDHSLQNIL